MTSNVANSFWADKALYNDAEKRYYESLAKLQKAEVPAVTTPVASIGNGDVKSKKSKRKNKNVDKENVPTAVVTAAPESVCPVLKKLGEVKASGEHVVPSNPPEEEVPAEKISKSKKKKNNKNKSQEGGGGCSQKSSLADEVAKAREHIKTSLESVGTLPQKFSPPAASYQPQQDVFNLLSSLQSRFEALDKRVSALENLDKRVSALEQLEKRVGDLKISSPAPAAQPKKAAKDDDDDVDLFGSESEEDDDDAKQIKEQRLAEYAAKKSKKPTLIAKSSIILDVKPWDDETDMKQLEQAVRKIEMDGLLWGASKLVPLAYGIHKLQITCVVEDDKVSVDYLSEQIEEISDFVQSVDIAAFNKI